MEGIRQNKSFLPLSTQIQKEAASHWFQSLQTHICEGLEALEKEFDPKQSGGTFQKTQWNREGGGGGLMAILEGSLFAKAGVNVSTVWGEFSPEFKAQIPGTEASPSFWASGVSLVIHPRSPHVPIIHMNTRHIVTEKAWFGGGIDLTPPLPQETDTQFFHEELQRVCDAFDPTFYPRFKEWAETYFYISHRQEPRGIGGIFYDYLGEKSWDVLMDFNCAIGQSFLPIYSEIVRRHWHQPWGDQEAAAQLKKRARYVEFNLIYDRGTLFGLKTGGNPEAILMSLPPQAGWPGSFSK